MPYSCSVRYCTSTTSITSLFAIPKKCEFQEKWLKFVKFTQPNWTITKTTRICAHHFKQEDFKNLELFQRGLKKQLVLKEEAIPTIYPKVPDWAEDSSDNQPGCSDFSATSLTNVTPMQSAPSTKNVGIQCQIAVKRYLKSTQTISTKMKGAGTVLYFFMRYS